MSQQLLAFTGMTPSLNVWDAALSGQLGLGAGQGIIQKRSTRSIGASLDLHILGYRSRLQYSPLDLNTPVSSTRGFTFRGANYLPADRLNLNFKWNTLDLEMRILNIGEDNLRMELVGGIQSNQTRVQLQASNRALSSDYSGTVVIPYFGLRSEMKMTEHLNLMGTAKLMDLEVLGNRIDYLDADISMRYSLAKNSDHLGSFIFGYRHRELNLRLDQGKANEGVMNLELKGPYAAWRIHF
ncbi:MAG: hypothetical protein H3C47_15200 [Candidatus Cloacimonetes bacterium]|nr:hypothetical protein [Candidatus Cloacimonadota bacterium]